MKKEFIKAITALVIPCCTFVACGDETKELTREKTQNEKVNEWIFSEMDSKYLYYQDMPAPSELDYTAAPKDFFVELLSRQREMKRAADGTGYFYSYIETPEKTKYSITSELTYGIDFVRYQHPKVPGAEIARVFYVLKDSPADKAGIKRGDYIHKINNQQINATNYALLKSGQAMTVCKAQFVADQQLGQYVYVQSEEPVSLTAAVEMDENPIHYSEILNYDTRKIGYLVYNAFKFGPTDDMVDFRYENELRDLMKSFKTAGVTEMILDLRYNGGGYVRTAQLLASTLVAQTNLGKLMAIQEMNDKQEKTNPEKEIYFYTSTVVGDANLDLKRLVVIGTRYTASASELIINSLRPYIPVIHVGEKTEGKNVGSYAIRDSKFPGYKLQPISVKIYNSLRQSDYASGFVPEASNVFSEVMTARPFAPFGSIDDIYMQRSLKALGVDLTANQSRTVSPVVYPELLPTGYCPIQNPEGVLIK
ncbi:MAG: S41 family peptidase [Bacteroidales bacterium]